MPEPLSVRYEFRGAQHEIFKRRDNSILISGAAGTGKSVACLTKLHLSCLAVPNVRNLVVRKTHASLTASTLVTFRQKVAQEAINLGVVAFYGGSAQEPASYRYKNGSAIVVGGLDKASRLFSTEYDLCFVDEAIEATAEDLDTILTRLRNGVLSYQQLLLATNPGAPTHHLMQRVNSGNCVLLFSQHEDNPRMFQDGKWTEYGLDYIKRLDGLSGVRLQRMRYGKWVAAEGIIYEDWNESVHLIDPFPIPREWTRHWSVDFGFVHPFVLQCWAEDPDGRLYLYREIYRTKRLVEDHAKRILSIVAPDGHWIEPEPLQVICDHDAEDRATLERHLGRSTTAARKTVSDGIQAVQARMRPQGDGKPRIFIFKNCTIDPDPELIEAKKPSCTAEEIPGYVWAPGKDGNPGKDEPLKIYDDGDDCLRYVVAQIDLVGRPNIRSFSPRKE